MSKPKPSVKEVYTVLTVKNKGFTLIELIIVIVILGVLAVTAAPKFLDFSKDAKVAALSSLKGTIKSAYSMVKFKLATSPEGFFGSDRYRFDDGQFIFVRGGNPHPDWNNTFSKFVDTSDITQIGGNSTCDDDNYQWCAARVGGSWMVAKGLTGDSNTLGLLFFPHGYAPRSEKCYVYYIIEYVQAAAEKKPDAIIGITTEDC